LISEEIFYHPQQPTDDRLTIRQHEQDRVFTDVRMAMNRYIITVKSIQIALKHGSIIVLLLYDGVTLHLFRLEFGAKNGFKTHLLPLGSTVAHGYNEIAYQSTYIYRPIIRDETVSSSTVCLSVRLIKQLISTLVTSLDDEFCNPLVCNIAALLNIPYRYY